jgi:hypothetical protein
MGLYDVNWKGLNSILMVLINESPTGINDGAFSEPNWASVCPEFYGSTGRTSLFT